MMFGEFEIYKGELEKVREMLIPQQLGYADMVLSILEQKLNEIFHDNYHEYIKINNININENEKRKDIKLHECLLKNAFNEHLKPLIRVAIKRNGFDNISNNLDWKDYVQNKSDYYFGQVTSYIKERYPSSIVYPYQNYLDSLDKKIVLEKCEDFFSHAKELSIQNKKQMDRIHENFQVKIRGIARKNTEYHNIFDKREPFIDYS